jgi:hypothetical protein
MSEAESKTLDRPKPPAPEYDRFGFQNSFKRADNVHWSRPWTVQPDDAQNEKSDG